MARQIGENRNVAVTTTKALFVDAHILQRFQISAQKSSLDGSFHDSMHALPVQAEQRSSIFYVATGLQHLDGKSLEHQRRLAIKTARMFACPGDGRRFHAARFALRSRSSCSQNCFKLHCVQMSPGSLRSMIGNPARGITLRARYGTTTINQQDLHTLLLQRKRDIRHFPGSVQT